MPIDAPGSVCGGQGADSAQIGRETDVALAMALIQTPFHTAWANKRHRARDAIDRDNHTPVPRGDYIRWPLRSRLRWILA